VRRSSFQSPTWGCQFALGQCAWFIYNRIWIVLQQGLAGWQGRLINIGVRRELVKTVLCALPTYLLTATQEGSIKTWASLGKGSCRRGASSCTGVNVKSTRRVYADHCSMEGSELQTWLWYQWRQPDKPWCNSKLPIDTVDEVLFVAVTRVTVHNWCTTRFWTSNWTQGTPLTSMFLGLFEHSKRENRTVAEVMVNEAWIRDLMHAISLDILTEYVMLWIVVDAIDFDPSGQGQDEIIWMRTVSGEYSARSPYQMQFQGSIKSNLKALVWQVWAP
jgi:hypothetical protein